MSPLPSGRAPNYRLRQNFQELEQGSFVRPVELYYLPEHVKKDLSHWFDSTKEVACYTRLGFKVIPRDLLEPT